ncbi:Pkinase-domain-containing protein [Aspergillus violaceofuscus CBS 115571]|uniref:cyclin-dependent kinase n=1 Tax=Aspergillus violaceofuscus (strain CBS 115571) TaxID=1450538 RepID=A0A2V5IG04_ASPV1|nr:Pkinase-domain-containing protein [Aspergillus violaceofuscus CBS 115571]
MAGSRRSPVLRDEWKASNDTGDQRDRERNHRPRGSYRDRGRDKFRDREPRRRPKEGRPDYSLRSPPPRSHLPYDHDSRPHREFSPPISRRGSSGLPPPDAYPSQKSDRHRSPNPANRPDSQAHRSVDTDRPVGKDLRRNDSPSAPPPSKRKRTRSPSPGGFHSHSNRPGHRRPSFNPNDEPDRGYLPNRRGRFSGRSRGGRRPSPGSRRGRERRKAGGGRPVSPHSRRSRSPVRGGKPYSHPPRRPHSPSFEDEHQDGRRYRSASRQSAQSVASRYSGDSRRNSIGEPMMASTRPTRPSGGDSHKSSSPRREPSIFDVHTAGGSSKGDATHNSTRGRRVSDASNGQHSRNIRPSAGDSHGSRSSYHAASPKPHAESISPYSKDRSEWTGQQSSYQNPHGRSPPQRQDNHSTADSQNQYQQPHHSSHSRGLSPSSGPTFRDENLIYRGNHQTNMSGSSPRERGNFNKSHWNTPSSRGQGAPSNPNEPYGPSHSPSPPPAGDRARSGANDDGDQYGRSRQESRADIERFRADPDHGDGDSQRDPPPGMQPSAAFATPNKGGKISFAFKAKTAPAPAPKPVPDLAQRMLAREPPQRAAEPPSRNRMPVGPPPKFKSEPRFDRRDRDRDRDRERDRRERERDRARNDRRDFRDSRSYRDTREPRGPREPRSMREGRRDDRRFDSPRTERSRGDRRQDFRPDRRPERSPEPRKQIKIMTRIKPRPVLSEEFANSDSVYYRKPGNESVIGAGTYGKVFKAIHVYTQRKVALKKIRMEGEKDGFPVTAVREIKLLQHLRNHNVVSLLEVMVERNECFMVFEYLSHDLTGLINHPTFTLTEAHKKDLAKQMFEGLDYLHHRGVMHRDIKAANILISNRGQLKYADFGLARFFSKSRQLDYTNRVITIWYRPPELLLGETRYGPAVDVWSAACVYVEMFTKKAVFPGEGGEISQLDKLYNCLGTPNRAEWPDLIEMPWFELMRPTERKKRIFEEVYGEVLSPAALDLISQVFQYDPAKRPTTGQILAHPYFTSEEPLPQQAIELENIEGDWHEFESKALRREKDKERRAEYQRDKEKRKVAPLAPQSDRDAKRIKAGSERQSDSAQPAEY